MNIPVSSESHMAMPNSAGWRNGVRALQQEAVQSHMGLGDVILLQAGNEELRRGNLVRKTFERVFGNPGQAKEDSLWQISFHVPDIWPHRHIGRCLLWVS